MSELKPRPPTERPVRKNDQPGGWPPQMTKEPHTQKRRVGHPAPIPDRKIP
jgi:hypothetical protein